LVKSYKEDLKNIGAIKPFRGIYALQGLMMSHFLRLYEGFPADRAGPV
jgi:hypothetical protein